MWINQIDIIIILELEKLNPILVYKLKNLAGIFFIPAS